MTEERVMIDTSFVRRLIASQFPQWKKLSIDSVATSGWDNRTFHLDKDKSVRLPSASEYELQVEKEHQWLPKLAPKLPLPIPVPIAMGCPEYGYPWKWSIYRWLDGETVTSAGIADLHGLATDLANFLKALHKIDATGGPPAGLHSFYCTIRQRCSRLVRKALSFSKKIENHISVIKMFICDYNKKLKLLHV